MLEQTSTNKTPQNLERIKKILQKYEKVNPTKEEEAAVRKLLSKHVPDYEQMYSYLKVGEFSEKFITDVL